MFTSEVPDAGVEEKMSLDVLRSEESFMADRTGELATVGVLALVTSQLRRALE